MVNVANYPGGHMLRLLVLALVFLAPIAAPEPAAALGGSCFGLAPMCPIGLRPACICYDAMGNNCSWQCVR